MRICANKAFDWGDLIHLYIILWANIIYSEFSGTFLVLSHQPIFTAKINRARRLNHAEDLPPALVTLSKNAGDAEVDAEDGGMEGTEAVDHLVRWQHSFKRSPLGTC